MLGAHCMSVTNTHISNDFNSMERKETYFQQWQQLLLMLLLLLPPPTAMCMLKPAQHCYIDRNANMCESIIIFDAIEIFVVIVLLVEFVFLYLLRLIFFQFLFFRSHKSILFVGSKKTEANRKCAEKNAYATHHS